MAWIKCSDACLSDGYCCNGKGTIMTNDIKDIVERLNLKQEIYNSGGEATNPNDGNPYSLSASLMKDAITALTTLSEDNAAMKLEIERLKDDTPIRKLEGDAKWIATDLIEKIEAKDKEIERLKSEIENLKPHGYEPKPYSRKRVIGTRQALKGNPNA